MPLGTNYSVYCLDYCQYQATGEMSERAAHLPNSSKVTQKSFRSYRTVTRRQIVRHFTRNSTDQSQNGSSNLFTPYGEQPRSTRIVVAYLRSAFSATKRINHVPISQVSQVHFMQKNTENCCTEIHGGGGLGLVEPARDPACSRPKSCASLKSAPFFFACLLLIVGPRRKKTDRGQRFPQKPLGSHL